MTPRPACPYSSPQVAPPLPHGRGPPFPQTFPEPLLPEWPKSITQSVGSGAQSCGGFQGGEAAPGGPQSPGATAPYE